MAGWRFTPNGPRRRLRAGRWFVRHDSSSNGMALQRASRCWTNSVKTTAMSRLADWALRTFGSLDAEFAEMQSFELDIYRFYQKAMP